MIYMTFSMSDQHRAHSVIKKITTYNLIVSLLDVW